MPGRMSREFEERIVEEIEEEVRSLLRKAREVEERRPKTTRIHYGWGDSGEILRKVEEGWVVIMPVREERVGELKAVLERVKEQHEELEILFVKTPSIIIAPKGLMSSS